MIFPQEKLEFGVKRNRNHINLIFHSRNLEFLIKESSFFARKTKWGPLYITVIHLGSILKSRDITLPTKVHLVKAMVFPVVMYGCESWTLKKAEHWRIDAFELWCWRTLLKVLGLQEDPTSPFWRRSALGFLWKEWY